MAVEASDKSKKADLNQNGNKNGALDVDSEPSELESKIITQVEYYFGDINLPRDKFMLEKIKADDGWIPMSVMMSFQRLAKLTNDPKVVAKALFHSDLMEVDESGSEIKIRRSPEHPLPEFDDTRRKALLDRSVYCARFPPETPLDALLTFFNKYGPVDNVIMRKYKDKMTKTRKFKGSVFVTFKTKEKGQEFLDLETVIYDDVELTKKWQADYLSEKKREIMELKMKRGKKANNEKDCHDAEGETADKFPKGAILHLSGNFAGLTRETIKETFSNLGYEPAYIDFKMGETQAHVRLSEENSGKTFLEKVGSQLKIGETELTARLVEGEEEKTFLQTAAVVRNAAIKRRQQSRKAGRKSKKSKANRALVARKRKASPATEGSPPAKKPVET